MDTNLWLLARKSEEYNFWLGTLRSVTLVEMHGMALIMLETSESQDYLLMNHIWKLSYLHKMLKEGMKLILFLFLSNRQ